MSITEQEGIFITFEGADGAGKTTQIKLLKEAILRKTGIDPMLTREPGGTRISEEIRGMLLDPENKEMCDETEALLYAASRAQHILQLLKPSVEAGQVVLCDRYVHSSIAYQGINGYIHGEDTFEESVKTAKRVSRVIAFNQCVSELAPHIQIFLYFPNEYDIHTRKGSKAISEDRIESKGQKLQRANNEYYKSPSEVTMMTLALFNEDIPMIFVDASMSIEDVHQTILADIRKVYPDLV